MNEIEQIETELRTERQRGALADGGKIAQLESRLAELQAAETNEVKTAISDSLTLQIQELDVFGAILPEEYQALIGLSEYNEKRQQLNQILHAYAVNIQSALVDKHAAEKVEWTAKLRELSDKNVELEADQAEQEAQLQSFEVYNEELEAKVKDLESKYRDSQAEVASLNEQLSLKQEQVDNLRVELANAPAPKVAIDVTPQPSQSLQDLLATTRAANSIKSAKDIALSGESFRGKVTLVAADGQTPLTSGITPPPVGGSESENSFRNEAAETDTQDDRLYNPGTDTTEVASGSVVEQTPTIEQLAARVAELEQSVFGKVKTAA